MIERVDRRDDGPTASASVDFFAGMRDLAFDAQERRKLCDRFDELGPSAATLLEGWTTHDLAAHLVLRERELVAGPCIVLPGPFQRFAERRRVRLAERRDFRSLVASIRCGPPPGFFRIGWVRSFPNLNEFFVHHEDVRRANGMDPRTLTPDLEAALWRNVRRSCRYLGRRLRDAGLEIEWTGTSERLRVRSGEPTARLSGTPGETVAVRLRAPACGARRCDRTSRGGRGGPPHTVRHVNPRLAANGTTVLTRPCDVHVAR